MERGFDLIEQLVAPPIDQFLKCVARVLGAGLMYIHFCVGVTVQLTQLPMSPQ